MIPSHQLRIGNYVAINEARGRITMISGTSALVEQDSKANDDTAKSNAPYDIERINPVPLSDTILKDCNFVYHDYFKFWQLLSGAGDTRSEMDIDRDYNILDFMRKPIVKTVASLHQLQNIYFFLKGKELAFRNT